MAIDRHTETMRAVRFHVYGEPDAVLRLEQVPIPAPEAGRIRVAVLACGLNPADWALCRGLFPGLLPRGIALDVSGTVDAIGERVIDVVVGDLVLGVADYAGSTSAGLADYAILNQWTPVPSGLEPIEAAALPMVVETAFRSIEQLGVSKDCCILIHGGGTMVGYAAVQMAIMRGAEVVSTAGETFAGRLRALGAKVTSYGEGMVERVRAIVGCTPDFVLDTSPPGGGVLPDLVQIAGGDPRRVLTVTDMAAAEKLGVRNSFGEGGDLRYDALAPFARLAAAGRFSVPAARTFSFDQWRSAMEVSLAGHAHGKLLILPR